MPARKKPRYVFSLVSTTVMVPERCPLRRGHAWYSDHPAVEKYPEMFSDDPPEIYPLGWVPPVELPVEQATAAPGEKRASSRATD
jgi:hypothetical protein